MQFEMPATFLIWFALGRLIYFPPEPLPNELARGVHVYTQHKGIERTLMEDRQELGRWFDGRVQRGVESAVWVSPAMTSRWLGYLQAKEKWSAQELQRRWDAVVEQLNGKLTFVVQVAAMPTLGGLDMDITSKADPAEVQKLRFLFTSGPGLPESHEKSYVPGEEDKVVARYAPGSEQLDDGPLMINPSVQALADWQVRDPAKLEGFRWEEATDFGEPFRSEFEQPNDTPSYPVGDYYSAWFVVSVNLNSLVIHPEGFDLRVFSPQKERIAHFTLHP